VVRTLKHIFKKWPIKKMHVAFLQRQAVLEMAFIPPLSPSRVGAFFAYLGIEKLVQF
jgi:hypothetical protein